MLFRIALPKGRLLKDTSELFEKSGWDIEGYDAQMRYYRLQSNKHPEIGIKVFQEKDIPIQVAVGNYDLGICGLNWIEELLVKYPSSAIVKVMDLGYGGGALFAAARSDMVVDEEGVIRIAGEYPNIAEFFAERLRLRRFSILPLWGAAEAYPPEGAEVVLLSSKTEKALTKHKLVPVSRLVDLKAYLIANRDSLKKKDMTPILATITQNLSSWVQGIDEPNGVSVAIGTIASGTSKRNANDKVRIALPDGHQQSHVCSIFNQAGIRVNDYPSKTGNRRPVSNLEGVFIKVIRPQDMPLQVANDNFDLAITGRDWLAEHRYQFPSSPVEELVDLKYGKVRLVAVISREVPAENVDEWKQIYHQNRSVCRVASEYINIADQYARDKRFGRYRIIPTWGATEAFLPEDADLLIENTETGGTIARHNLKIIDTLFESTACLVGSKQKISNKTKRERIERIVEALKSAVGEG
ncbi:MAG: ATP phosphoribosyltransferase [Dehalococcoidia bacterium]|nr:MAG: ATP phosphoribosyltransferase [Dehalococcoidia bacterium]